MGSKNTHVQIGKHGGVKLILPFRTSNLVERHSEICTFHYLTRFFCLVICLRNFASHAKLRHGMRNFCK